MKLRKKLMLLEDFDAQTNLKVNTEVKSEVKPEINTGDVIRTEVIADVDTILTNLEQLSKQITEDVDALINDLDNVFQAFNEDFKYEAVNEDFMKTMLQAITDMKNYGALKSAYKPAATAVMNAEVTKVQKGAEFDSQANIKTEEAEQKLKDKWNEKIKAEGQKHADNIPKKNKIQTKLRELRDDAVKSAVSGSIKKKVDAQKVKLNLAEDANIKKAQEKLGEITKDFPLSSEGLLAKQWNTEKNEIDLDIASKKIDLVTAAETEFLDDPEMIEKIEKRAADKLKKQEAEAKELAGKFKDDLAAQEAKLAKQEAEAMNDPKKKEAITAIKEYYGSAKEYLGVLGGVSAELTDEEKDAINASKKKYNAAKKGFTAAKLKKTGDYTEDEASEEITSMTGSIESAVAKFKDIAAKAEGAELEKKNKIKEKIAELKEELKTAKDDLEAAKTSADGDMEDPGVIAVQKKVADLETKIKEQEELLVDSVQIEETEEVSEAVNASGYIKAGKLGYDDQFLERKSLSYTLSTDLGLNPKHEFGGGDWLGFDHVSLYAEGGKKTGTILDDALTDKYTYNELKAAAADFLGIKESKELEEVTELVKSDEPKCTNRKGHLYKQIDKDGTVECVYCGLRNSLSESVVVMEEVEEVEEGNQFGAARAEAIAKGEKTFKVGDEEYPVEDVSKEDEENAKEFVEEAKEELPKTIKLDEGLTIAQRFSKLM